MRPFSRAKKNCWYLVQCICWQFFHWFLFEDPISNQESPCICRAHESLRMYTNHIRSYAGAVLWCTMSLRDTNFGVSPLGNLGQRPFALTPGSCSICKQAPSSKHCPFQETKHVETVDFPQFTKKTCNIVGCAIEVYACTVITPTWLWCFTLAHFPILLSSWVHFYEDLWASSLKLATSWPKVSSPAFLHHHLSDLGIRDMLPGKKGVKRPRKRTSLAVLLEHDPLDH